MSNLSELENKSIYIIREAYNRHKNVALLWSIGKDSTTLLWLIRKAFFGKIPFPVVHLDTGYKFKQIYEFRDKYAKQWDLDLIVAKNKCLSGAKIGPEHGKLECCTENKTNNLKKIINEKKYKALYLAIRRDEHGIRAKERVFSPRDKDFTWDYKDQPVEMWDQYENKTKEEEHLRIHPVLDWKEIDIWRYIKKENIPTVSLYFAKDGKRFRSIGCTKISERSGRAQDKESDYMMQKLRSLGYM